MYSEIFDEENQYDQTSYNENESTMLEKEYGIQNVLEYKTKFENLILSLEEDKIYKII